MSRSVCHVATSSDQGKRLDAVLAEEAIYRSRSEAAKFIEAGKVTIAGAVKQKNHKVSQGEVIICEIEDALEKMPVTGEPIPLDVRYEDDDIIVISKQRGLVCHPADNHRSGTLVNALIYRFGAENLCNVQGEDDRLGIVHRLDGDTSGLMIAAKTNDAGLLMMDAIGLREVDRRYIALIHGVMAPDTGLIDAPIARNPKDRTTMSVNDGPSSRDAITTFKVLERFEPGAHDDGYTLVECKLYTGRTHQIRVHMQYAKHPIVGDPVYNAHGPKGHAAQLGLDRQFLHSYKLGFAHPITGKPLSFTDGLPDDLRSALARIEGDGPFRTQYGSEVLEGLESEEDLQ